MERIGPGLITGASDDDPSVGNQWGMLHDEDIKGEYLTKEAAFEVATAAASAAVRLCHEVHLSVTSREGSGFAGASAEQQG